MKDFFLGVVQGLTEFLPVSSSGHLGLFSKLFGLQSNLSLFAFLHLATFLVVLIFLWKDVWSILYGMFKLDKEIWNLVFKLIVATIPAGLVGLFFEKKIENIFSSQWVIGIFFLITAAFLWFSDAASGRKSLNELSFLDALLIGLFQAVAVLPGISRSGITLVGALLVGLNRADAFKFSFLLSLPITLAAGLFELKDVVLNAATFSGFGGAFVAGIVALLVVKQLTISAHLRYFSIYLILPAILSFFIR
ncbi:MAG: undecaprenyl-diphosphate phosphatase [Fervidobacterium sp.]|uniref:Undecaprenyl-diphosphatase n=1 Tax=Fervidobacterium gondwanense DSM 13020 TaxID=1121883 RepID=A0A1M7TIQ2_FERGO|nr:undecaprenyl-diphosphate phosphatase [Fervidobacterium gondwanense]UXF00757.1 UDP-diphosphatase [Fervidobacterium riparium]SHN70571.1 undecaprenyl-diphosphatase [Fervidobacterium gondwanense DSM 13020]